MQMWSTHLYNQICNEMTKKLTMYNSTPETEHIWKHLKKKKATGILNKQAQWRGSRNSRHLEKP